MASISKSANLQFYLNGEEINAPVQWKDIAILATFENDAVQANITIDQFEFVNQAREIIINHLNDGRIFEGLPFQIVATGTNNSLTVFDGLIDLTNEFDNQADSVRAVCSIAKKDGLNTLEQRLSALNYDYLYELGIITDADFVGVPYVIEKTDDSADIVLLLFMGVFLTDAIIQQIADTAEAIATASGILAAGITGAVGSAIFAVANALLQAAKLAALVIAFAELGRRVIELLAQPKRTHKGILLKTLLSKACEQLGYSFETDIADLDNIVYLPSNNGIDTRDALGRILSVNTIEKGTPAVNDFGFNAVEAFEIATDYFNAKTAIVDNTVQFRSKDSSFWIKTASYTMPDVLIESEQYNTDELIANKLFSFDTDTLDEWTAIDFTGTNYEVITNSVDPQNTSFVKGLQEVRYNVCLGSRKEKESALQSALRNLAGIFDDVINIFGGNSDLQGLFDDPQGVLRVSQNNHSKPKLLYLQNGNIPANHRELLSAKASYNNYHYYDSFVLGNYNGQKRLYNGVRVGFGLDDFVKLIENSYFYTNEGEIAQAIKIESNLALDFAVMSYFIRQPYTERLSETVIEP